METVGVSNIVSKKEKFSLKSLISPKFQSKTTENKYLKSYLTIIYPSRHRLLVLILVSHGFISLFDLFLLKIKIDFKIKLISMILLFLSILINFLSLIIKNRLKTRLISNFISLLCLFPLILLTYFYPNQSNLFLLIILIYTLANFSLPLSLFLSIILIILIIILSFHSRIYLILLLVTNFIGIYINRLLDMKIRSAYNQLCKNALVRYSLLTEHTLISKMIDSLMPQKYSRVIMEDFDVFRERVQKVNILDKPEDQLQTTIFRPLHIERMENVSILFADIVGFTQMSSNKSATQLVSLLSDLYGRFDDLCVQMSCEKIATLGDCYYCVSGCPEPVKDHAKSSLLMGLAMINAIEEFDQDNNEQVDMRVGVHSGSVNCGIVGTRKFKFDIFSNDVTLANKMESTGKPGYVHITESTYSLVKSNEFQFEDGPPYHLSGNIQMKTYFIGKRRLSHRITRKPPQMTLATAAAVAVASGVSLSVPLNNLNNISNQSEQINVSSPLLEEVEQARRATISEDESFKGEIRIENVENLNETRIEDEEKELVMAFNFLTLKYKEKKIEKSFLNYLPSKLILIIEILLSILSFLIIYFYFYLIQNQKYSLIILICFLIKLILTLIFILLNKYIIKYSKLIYLLSIIYLLSPLIIFLTINENIQIILPCFVLFLSTYLTLGSSLSHLFKLFLAFISIIIYYLFIIFKQQIQSSSIIEISISVLISLIVLYGISREIELSRRCQYHVIHKSSEQRIEIDKERERADWLLRNILPEHVIEPLRQLGGTYSRNHPCVGVLFASLINFHVMYEEQYEGGKFYARILNEFYGDIEELFLDPRFTKIEKIKTIGSTYMAASGLKTDSNDENSLEPVCDLIEFALAFQQTMHQFNEALLNFAFELRMGFNFGPVTAGVIGTTKLFYDIWGDTVNVASRMDSTGQKGEIQVPEHVALALKDKYQFELRGEIDVKGKSRMKTYFLKPKSKI